MSGDENDEGIELFLDPEVATEDDLDAEEEELGRELSSPAPPADDVPSDINKALLAAIASHESEIDVDLGSVETSLESVEAPAAAPLEPEADEESLSRTASDPTGLLDVFADQHQAETVVGTLAAPTDAEAESLPQSDISESSDDASQSIADAVSSHVQEPSEAMVSQGAAKNQIDVNVGMLPSEVQEDLAVTMFREPVAPPRREPKVLVVAGAKGGVGKTMTATNLAVYLATIGRQVVLVDADEAGANTHHFLGMDHPYGLPSFSVSLPEFVSGGEDEEGIEPVEAPPPQSEPARVLPQGMRAVPSPFPSLSLAVAGIDEPLPGARAPERRGKLLSRAREFDADYVVIDIGASTSRSVLDTYIDADLSLFVTLPEPAAIENTYRFVRALFARQLRRTIVKPTLRRAVVQRLRRLGHAPAPTDLLVDLETSAYDPDALFIAADVRKVMDGFRFHLMVNQTRVRADLDLGESMISAAWRRLGLRFRYLGYVDYDDTVWSCARKRKPVLVESPGAKASKSLEKIARRLLSIEHGKYREPSRPSVPQNTHHDLLEVDRGGTDEEVRRAYKRAKAVYANDSLARRGLFDDESLQRFQARIQEAYDVLLDPARRRPYELSVFPEPIEAKPKPAINSIEPKPPAPAITPDTEFTGGLLRAVRRSQGVRLTEVAERSKVQLSYLSAIEDDDYASLPALVYVRGFVGEFAKFLRLDAHHVTRTYIRRYRKYLDDNRR